jgi:hypothetical protein
VSAFVLCFRPTGLARDFGLPHCSLIAAGGQQIGASQDLSKILLIAHHDVAWQLLTMVDRGEFEHLNQPASLHIIARPQPVPRLSGLVALETTAGFGSERFV